MKQNRASAGDTILRLLTFLMAVGVVGLITWVGWQMFSSAKESINAFGWSFVTNRVWDPVKQNFGALPFIYGTIVTSLIALVVAGPIGLGVAIFNSFGALGIL